MADVYFEVTSLSNKKIRITREYWNLIITVKHTPMKGREELVKSALKEPDEIRKSNKDRDAFLYNKAWGKYFVVVVCKHLNGEGYITTTYISDRIKAGEITWKRHK
ncbi:MAG: DUF4258 domain-containing protein [Candidatus Micrarchaeales archaeon]